jgi:hypothetical protein
MSELGPPHQACFPGGKSNDVIEPETGQKFMELNVCDDQTACCVALSKERARFFTFFQGIGGKPSSNSFGEIWAKSSGN